MLLPVMFICIFHSTKKWIVSFIIIVQLVAFHCIALQTVYGIFYFASALIIIIFSQSISSSAQQSIIKFCDCIHVDNVIHSLCLKGKLKMA